jgi:hypothetical protein
MTIKSTNLNNSVNIQGFKKYTQYTVAIIHKLLITILKIHTNVYAEDQSYSELLISALVQAVFIQ